MWRSQHQSSKKNNHLEKGKYYEDIACQYLRSKKYRIITRNYRTRLGEIDLICSQGESLVFVEVKGGKKTPEPFLRVTQQKLLRLERTMRHYLHHHENNWTFIRLDVISISEPDLDIQHFIDVLSD